MAINSIAAFAQAQAEAEAPQRVEITGSRIRQVDLETAQPVLKITQQQIQATGLVTVGDILNQMSSAGTPAFSKGSTLTSNREQGGQYIDMRNLGSNRLLVLVNGKRWTQSVDGYTDLSTVPSSMIERMEILKDGASSIYGSDAIAGVVNIILKKTLEGGQLSIYTGRNEQGDGRSKDYSLSYGAGNDQASLMFGLTHTAQGAVWAKDREITATSYGPDHLNAGFGAGPWGRIARVNPTTGAALIDPDKGGFNRYLNHTGSYMGDGTGASSRNPANFHDYKGADADTFNSSSQMMFAMPTQLTSIFTKGSIQLPKEMRFTTTAMFAERQSSRQVAGYPLNSLTQSKYPVYLDKNSYYNPYGNSVAGAGNGQDIFFYRRTIEVPRVTDNRNQTLHVDATLEGEFNLRGLPWTWSAGYNHSAITGKSTGTGNINLLNLKKAVGPSFLNASGVVQCGTAASPIPLAECTPFDILGGPSASTPQALNYIMSTAQGTFGSTIQSATADVSGELFTLPAGALGVAGGIEHRTVRGYDRPGQFEQSGYSTDLAANSTSGRYTVKEAYLEANIPLLKGKPFADYLGLDLASRYSDYSSFGSTTNSKASFMWKPIKDLLTRGTYAEGFRAPTLGDTFGGGSQSYDSYLDACDSLHGVAARNPAVAARCAAAGVPANFRQKNQAGSPVPAGGAQTPVPFNTGAGNDSLTPETAKTRTLGLVYSPSFVPGLSVNLDWFDIRVANRITGVTSNYTIEQCYVSGVQSFCDKIKRDTTGQISSLSRGNANLGSLTTEGLDFGFSYRLPRNPYGQFTVRSESTYVDSFTIKSTEDGEADEYVGLYDGNPYHRLKSNVSVDWALGNWSATLTTRYYSKVKDRCYQQTAECSNPSVNGSDSFNQRNAMVYSDLSVGYKTSWKGKILVGVNNLFNKKPRVIYNAASGFGGDSSSSAVDPNMPIDQFFYARYNQDF